MHKLQTEMGIYTNGDKTNRRGDPGHMLQTGLPFRGKFYYTQERRRGIAMLVLTQKHRSDYEEYTAARIDDKGRPYMTVMNQLTNIEPCGQKFVMVVVREDEVEIHYPVED